MNGKKKSNMWLVICLLMLALAVAGPAAGRTITVDDNEPADFKSIQAAINAAVSGVDEIKVAPGTYNEYISFIGKAVRLYSSDGPRQQPSTGAGIIT